MLWTVVVPYQKCSGAGCVKPSRNKEGTPTAPDSAVVLRGVLLAVMAKWLDYADASITARITRNSHGGELLLAAKTLGARDIVY